MPPCTLTERIRTEGGEAELSSYEDYTRKSGNYDKTREPVGTEILVGCFAHAPVPLDRTVVLDAGCGTGSYSDALLGYVGRIEAVDTRGIGLSERGAVGSVTREQLRQIAETKLPDPNVASVEGAMKAVEGTARSMGVKVVG
jgi:Ribosomal protein L11, RNA binding domain